jgi:cytochrome c-type biogenesis protein CcmE
MKLSHVIALLVIACMIGIIVVSAGDASQYVSFQQAEELAKDGDDTKVHVVGDLPRNSVGEIIGIEYNPTIDPNYIAFDLIDESGEKRKIVCHNPPPSVEDLKRSEKVVVIGSVNDKGQFIAKEILLKCPSKYEDKEIKS